MLLIEEVSNEVITDHWQEIRIAYCAVLGLGNVDLVFVKLLFFLDFLYTLVLPVLVLLLFFQRQEQRVFLKHTSSGISLTSL